MTPDEPVTGERILVVSPYPPRRDGIGAYAQQQVKRLRAAGHHVEVCSPAPSAAHHHLPLVGPKGAAALGRLAHGFDRMVIHFHPDVFYRNPATPGSRIAEGLALGAALRSGPKVEIRLHEIDHRWADPTDPSAAATRWMLRGADRITVHSREQRDHLVDGFKVPAGRVELTEHGADFVRRTSADRSSARASLGLPADDHVFLCIGFVQPHKGFDRAVRAFDGLGAHGARIDVVGSVRLDDPRTADHVEELRRLERTTDGFHLHLGFVSDEAFDRWIVAADTVVLPYRHIWSSSVAERAALYERPVIATHVGGLADQLEHMPGAVLVADNAGLARAMAAAAGQRGDGAGPPIVVADPWPVAGGVDRDRVQREVQARATTTRGGRTVVRAPSGGRRAVAAPSAPLRRLGPLTRPAAVSARPGVSAVKKLIRRVVAWEIDPLAEQLNRLQRATTEAVEAQTELIVDEAADDAAPPAQGGDEGPGAGS